MDKKDPMFVRSILQELAENCAEHLMEVRHGQGILPSELTAIVAKAQTLRIIHPEGLKRSSLLSDFNFTAQTVQGTEVEKTLLHIKHQAERAAHICGNKNGHNPRQNSRQYGQPDIPGFTPLFS